MEFAERRRRIDRFACGYCGAEHIVKRGGGIVSLAPVVQGLQQVQTGVDKTASELAIQRLEKERAEISSQIRIVTERINKEIYLSHPNRRKIERLQRERYRPPLWLLGQFVSDLLADNGLDLEKRYNAEKAIEIQNLWQEIEEAKRKPKDDPELIRLEANKTKIENEIAKHKRIVLQ